MAVKIRKPKQSNTRTFRLFKVFLFICDKGG
jgi:hypothetical protein